MKLINLFFIEKRDYRPSMWLGQPYLEVEAQEENVSIKAMIAAMGNARRIIVDWFIILSK
jgi:hypothetical protein